MRNIIGINEIDISVADFDNSIMKATKEIPLIEKLKFFKNNNVKLRLSVLLLKGFIDSEDKLKKLMDISSNYVDKYVVRTLYDGSFREDLYVDFDYNDNKIVWERNNTACGNNILILGTDNNYFDYI